MRSATLTLLVVAIPLSAGGDPTAHGGRDDAMARFAAGTFVYGSVRGDRDERPVRRLRLAAFAIDRHEVTRAQYARCVAAGACRAPRRFPKRDVGGPRHPAVGVSWHDARSYCRFRGKRLPTEAEWERAARGRRGRRYPWGATLGCRRANFGNFRGSGRCARVNPGGPLPVGSRPRGATPEGVHDLAGNVWEWVADRYRSAPRARPTDRRVLRGGSCCSYFVMPRAANRHRLPPDYRDFDIGFRCARSSPAKGTRARR